MTPQTIDAYGVRLRPFRLADVADTVAACADPVTQRFIPGMPNPYTEESARWWAGTRSENVASQRVLEKVGFRREGLLRGRLPGPDGARTDSLVYGLLPADRTR